MKPLDQFKRTPPRRYDKAPPPPPGDKRTFEPAIRKRCFDMPTFDHRHIDRWLGGAVCAVLLLTLCNASAPMGDVPSVQERFSQWAVIQNEKTVQQLPGATPEPDSALAAAASFNPDQEKQEVKQEARQETILAQEETRQEKAQTQTTADTSTGFKHYEPGQLHYESDGITVSIEQKTKDGMTYFVCDIQLERVEQFRTAFAGDDFKSGIYEAVSDIAGRYNPVLAINADFCRYHRDGVIIRNGEVLRRQNIKKHHLLVVDQNGDLSAQTDRSGKQGLVANKLEQAKTWQTFEFGPVLVEDGKAATLPSSFYVNCHDGYYEPRTAIGQLGPLHYIVIVVDGRPCTCGRMAAARAIPPARASRSCSSSSSTRARNLRSIWTAAAQRRSISGVRSSTCPPAARSAPSATSSCLRRSKGERWGLCPSLSPSEILVHIACEVGGQEHGDALLARLAAEGYDAATE